MTARKKKAGKVVRLSKEVETALLRRKKGRESYDVILRRTLGIPSRKGIPSSLWSGYLLLNFGSPRIFQTLAEARGEAILAAVRKKRKSAEKPRKIMEVA